MFSSTLEEAPPSLPPLFLIGRIVSPRNGNREAEGEAGGGGEARGMFPVASLTMALFSERFPARCFSWAILIRVRSRRRARARS